MIDNQKVIGSARQNLVLETVGRVYIKVADRYYELDFRNKSVKESTEEEVAAEESITSSVDLSQYVDLTTLNKILNSYIKRGELPNSTSNSAILSYITSIQQTIENLTDIVESNKASIPVDIVLPSDQTDFTFITSLTNGTEVNSSIYNEGWYLILPTNIVKSSRINPPTFNQPALNIKYFSKWEIDSGNDCFEWADMASEEVANQPFYANIPEGALGYYLKPNTYYYVYVKVPKFTYDEDDFDEADSYANRTGVYTKVGTKGEYYISETQVPYEDNDYYYLYVEHIRTYAYPESTVVIPYNYSVTHNAGEINIAKFKSNAYNIFIDLNEGTFKLGNKLTYENGILDIDVPVYEYRFKKTANNVTPTITASTLNPEGWTTAIPTTADTESLWMISCQRTKTALVTNWSGPIRICWGKGAVEDNNQGIVTGDQVYDAIMARLSDDYVTLHTEQNNIDGFKTIYNMYVSRSLALPTIAPDTTQTWYDNSRSYLYVNQSGNYSQAVSGGSGGGSTVHKLRLRNNSIATAQYDLGEADADINIASFFADYITSAALDDYVTLHTAQTIDGAKKHLNVLVFNLPTSAPGNDAENNKAYLYSDINGNYSQVPGGGSSVVAQVYNLTIRNNSVSVGPYNLGEQAADINIASLLADYATKSWVEAKGYLTSAALEDYVTIATDQEITGKKTMKKVVANGYFAIPTAAPDSYNPTLNPPSGLTYLYANNSGNYSQDPENAVARVYNLTIRRGSVSAGTYNLGEDAADIDLSTLFAAYATTDWINSQNFATQSWVNNKNYLTDTDLAAYVNSVITADNQPGNAYTRFTKSGHVVTFYKDTEFVDVGSAQTITGAKKHKNVVILNLPTSGPGNEAENTKAYLYDDTTGNYSQTPSEEEAGFGQLLTLLLNGSPFLEYDGTEAVTKNITAVQPGNVKTLTIKKNNADFAGNVYNPLSGSNTVINFTVTKSDVGLSNVEDTALSTWTGSTHIVTVGTITTGTWNGNKITNAYLQNSSITLNGHSVSLGGSLSLNLDDIGDGTNRKWENIVFTNTDQVITGTKSLKSLNLLNIPTVAPASLNIAGVPGNNSYLYSDPSGSYAQSPNNSVAHIYNLTIRRGSVSVGPYNLGEDNANIDISSLFSDYATEAWVLGVLGDNSFSSSNTVKSFINSSIATATAEYKGSKNLVSNLNLGVDATRAQIAAALGTAISGADNNDYCFVEIPTSGSTPTEIAKIERYKFNGTSWAYEYQLNNSGFTSAQWAAINSGIDSTKRAGYDTVVNTYVPNTRTVNGHALSANVTLLQADIIGSSAIGSSTQPVYYTGSALAACSYDFTNYLPLAGGQMTGANPLAFMYNTVQVNFRTGHDNYNAKLGYFTAGNEALVFANKNPVTSFIFKCGADMGTTTDVYYWYETNPVEGEPSVGTPTIQLKYQSLYVNQAIADGVSPSYNFQVTGSSFFNGATITKSLFMQYGYYLYRYDSDGNLRSILDYSGNTLELAWGNAHAGYNTNIHGGTIALYYSTSHTQGIYLNSSGNVIIGSGSPSYKLHVNGTLGVVSESYLNGGAKVSTFLAIPTAAPSSSASWYSSSDYYLYANTSGNYSQTPSGGGGSGTTSYALTLRVNSVKLFDFDGSVAVDQNITIPVEGTSSSQGSGYYASPSYVNNNYLPLTGGTINSTSSRPLYINTSAGNNYLLFGANSTSVGELGYYPSFSGSLTGMYMQLSATGYPTLSIRSDGNAYVNENIAVHAGNIPAYALARFPWWVDSQSHDVDSMSTGITFAYTSHNAPTTGTIVTFNCSNSTSYPLQIMGKYWASSAGEEQLWFRNRNGDNGTWTTWRQVIHSGNIGSQDVDTVDGYHASNLLAWEPYITAPGSNAPFQGCVDYFNNLNNLNNGAKLIYDHSGTEWTVLFTRRPDSAAHGSILKWGYSDPYLRIIRMVLGQAQSTDWEKIYAGYADSAGNADTLDGYHGSAYRGFIHSGTTGSGAGYWHKIKIGTTDQSQWTVAFTVRIYQSYRYYDFVISGYNYGDYKWYAPRAIMTGSSIVNYTEDYMPVKFGYDGYNELWVAIQAGDYYGIDIFDCTNGYYQYDFNHNFTISLVAEADLGTVQSTQNVYRPVYFDELVSRTGAYVLKSGDTMTGSLTLSGAGWTSFNITRTGVGSAQMGVGGNGFYTGYTDANSELAYTYLSGNSLALYGTLEVSPGSQSSWREGIRILPASNGWTTLILGSSATSGTGENAWSFHTYSGTFYLANNGSSSFTRGIAWPKNGAMTVSGVTNVENLTSSTGSAMLDFYTTVENNTAARGRVSWENGYGMILQELTSGAYININSSGVPYYMNTYPLLHTGNFVADSNYLTPSTASTTYVPKKDASFYPYLTNLYQLAKCYKITLPYAELTGTRWEMVSMDIIVKGDYSSAENGTIHLQYYACHTDADGWSVPIVSATSTGQRFIAAQTYIKYDPAAPYYFWVVLGGSYTIVAIENLGARDSAYGLDFRQVTISNDSTANIPSTAVFVNWGKFDYQYDLESFYMNKDLALDNTKALKWWYDNSSPSNSSLRGRIYMGTGPNNDYSVGDMNFEATKWTSSSDITSFKFSTYNDNYALVIKNDGRVGLGTYSPLGKFHLLSGRAYFGGGQSSVISSDTWNIMVGLEGTRTSNAYNSGIAFNHMLGYNGNRSYAGYAHAWIGLRFVNSAGREASSLVFATMPIYVDGTESQIPLERMCITPDGNVGINDTAPSYELSVQGTTFSKNLFVINDSSQSTYDTLAYFRCRSDNDWGVIIDKGSHDYGLRINASGSYSLQNLGGSRLVGAVKIGADSAAVCALDISGEAYIPDRLAIPTSGPGNNAIAGHTYFWLGSTGSYVN